MKEGGCFSGCSGWDHHLPICSPAGRECKTLLWLSQCSQDMLSEQGWSPHSGLISHSVLHRGLQLGDPTSTQLLQEQNNPPIISLEQKRLN